MAGIQKLFTGKQSDLDKVPGLALGLNLPATPETIQRNIKGEIIQERSDTDEQHEDCPECGQPDLHFDSCSDFPEYDPYYECYNCGYTKTIKRE